MEMEAQFHAFITVIIDGGISQFTIHNPGAGIALSV
jgi:hypothetical protein